MSDRIAADTLFMMIACLMAERGTCQRAQVGAVIAQDRRIISTGYVGSPPGAPHCLDVGCLIDDAGGGCTRTIHAEANAIAYAARSGLRVEGATLYSTHAPCRYCSQIALSSGIKRVVFNNEYRDDGVGILAKGGARVERMMNLEVAGALNGFKHPFVGYPVPDSTNAPTQCLLCGSELYEH